MKMYLFSNDRDVFIGSNNYPWNPVFVSFNTYSLQRYCSRSKLQHHSKGKKIKKKEYIKRLHLN